MSEGRLGSFEELVLLTIANFGCDAYAVPVRKSLSEYRSVTMGSVYSALDRLEQKGFLRSYMGGITPEKGGKRKRMYCITGSGKQILLETRLLREKLWSGLSFGTDPGSGGGR